MIGHAPPQRERDSGEHQERRDIESVKQQKGGDGVEAEAAGGKSKEVSDVGQLVARQSAEMDPAEDQGEGDGDRQHAAPEEALVHPPSQTGAVRDEALRSQVSEGESGDTGGAAQQSATAEELPTAIPVDAGGRLLQPDIVMVDDAPGGEDHGEGVDDQGGIEVLQIARADRDGGDEEGGPECGPCAGAQTVGRAAQVGGQGQVEVLLLRDEDAVVGPPEEQRGAGEQQESRPDGAGALTEERQQERGKNPPKPPMAPTRPVTVPVCPGKYCGTSLNTAPLPSPSSAAVPRAPTVNGTMDDHASSMAKGATPANTADRTRAPPMRSESQPPRGRMRVARTTKPAVRNPASAGDSLN